MPKTHHVRFPKRKLTDRELNTVLASLRVLQANPALFPREFSALKQLSMRGINQLCFDINVGRVRI
jgi:hypothetical protein